MQSRNIFIFHVRGQGGLNYKSLQILNEIGSVFKLIFQILAKPPLVLYPHVSVRVKW